MRPPDSVSVYDDIRVRVKTGAFPVIPRRNNSPVDFAFAGGETARKTERGTPGW